MGRRRGEQAASQPRVRHFPDTECVKVRETHGYRERMEAQEAEVDFVSISNFSDCRIAT